MSTDVAIVILAGGEGSRIGGGKPLVELAGERLIVRALRFARRFSDCVAVAVRDARQVGSVEAQLIPDNSVEGPLGGLLAGLEFARREGRGLLLVIPADMPFLPNDLLDRLLGAIGPDQCAIAASGGSEHPVCSLWRAEAVERVPEYVATGRRSLKGLADLVGKTRVDWDDAPDPFFNINSAADLEEAERLVARWRSSEPKSTERP
jgi:molybdopterin-guanine dinucleotide biosynthesis protein A